MKVQASQSGPGNKARASDCSLALSDLAVQNLDLKQEAVQEVLLLPWIFKPAGQGLKDWVGATELHQLQSFVYRSYSANAMLCGIWQNCRLGSSQHGSGRPPPRVVYASFQPCLHATCT